MRGFGAGGLRNRISADQVQLSVQDCMRVLLGRFWN